MVLSHHLIYQDNYYRQECRIPNLSKDNTTLNGMRLFIIKAGMRRCLESL